MCRSRLCCGILLFLQMCLDVYCECVQCSPVTSEGWYSELMVCDIGSRNATLMWREDASVSNASYSVIYQVSTRTMRSDLIHGEEEIFTYEISNLTSETNYTVQVCQPDFGTCDQCKVDFRTLAATEPMQVMNVRVYVYHPILDDSTTITALVVWDALEGGGVVDKYYIVIQDDGSNNVFESQTTGNESYIIVRDFVSTVVNNILHYPLESNMMYEVQVFAGNDGGYGAASDLVRFSTDGVRPPQQQLLVTSNGSHLYDSEVVKSYTAVSPVTVNTLWRMMYWYNSTLNSVMSQSLDGKDIIEFLRFSPISVSTMAYEWQGERLYMAGFNDTTSRYELWRVPVVYSKGLELVYQMSEGVESVSDLIVDSFRQGGAYWLQEVDGKSQLAYLNLSNIDHFQILNTKVERRQAAIHIIDFNISALTLNPTTGHLWVSDHTDGGIFSCSINGTCEVVVDAIITGVPVVSIGMDENTIYWTNGSAINSVTRADPNSTLSVSNAFRDESVVVSIHSLSPGQQPQYWRCDASRLTTCLAPDLVVAQTFTLTMLNPIIHTTTTSIEVWWSQPPLIACCAGEVFSYPLVQYSYGIRGRKTIIPDDPFARHLRIDDLRPFISYNLLLNIQNIYTIEEREDALYLWLEGVTTNPVVSVGFDPTRYNVLEGDSTDLVIRKMGDAEGSVVASVSTSDITAIADADYEPLEAVQVVFQPGVFTQTLTLNTITELASEGDEQLRATLTAVTIGVGIIADTATVTITEDVEPTLSFSTVDEVVEEDEARAEVCLMLNIPLDTPLDVSVTSATGSASVNDFVVETLTASFAAGDTEACVVFTVIDDTIALEPDETFTATFQPPDGIRTEGPLSATVTIIDEVVDDDVFTIQFSEIDYSFEEGEMGAMVCLDGVGTIAQPATATISSLAGGPATVGEDYTAISSVEVTFQPGDTMMCVELGLPQDEILEGEESFRIAIEAVGPLHGIEIGARDETTVFIRDDDVARIGFDPVLYGTNEEFGFVTVTVRLLDGILSDDVIVTLTTEEDFAIDGADYLGVVEDLVFGPGINRVDVNISIIDDNTYEPDTETFRVLLSLATTGAAVNIDPAMATISITDDDRPVPQFVDRMYVVPENERSNVPLCIDIGVTITSPITYTVTTEQKSPPEAEVSDFGTTASITVNPPGPEGCTNFEALVVDDNVAVEGDEAFTIQVDGSMAMVTILDDDVPELTTRDVTVSEGVGEASVCVRLANTVEGPFGIRFDTSDGTAQASGSFSVADDYFPRSGAFGFMPDETCEGIRINDDDLQEPTENLFVTFVPDVPGARSVIATVNIRDNEPIVGDIVNDTIIGDPLFTATLPDGDEFMCYEVHGQAGKYFNLISDACLSVNAFFSALPEDPRINRISEIGIYARDSADTCVPIEIDLEGCTGSIRGQPFVVGPSGQVRYEQNGISVRSYPARWRVSVPNCGSTLVVMWIFCGSDPAMMRIHIARGNGLAQSSHGLLAQFWNIPVTVLREGDQVTLQLFDDSLDPRYRLIPAEPAPRTWDHTRATCYYVGNAQGGPAHSHDAIESVIQGNLLQYETSTLFSPDFDFSQFEDSFCITPA